MSYWDTSCLVKLYTPEPDSPVLRNHLAGPGRCVTSDVTPLEFWATVRRKESEGILAPGEARRVQAAFESDIELGLVTIMVSNDPLKSQFRSVIEQCYSQSPSVFVRTNDALHLAAAREAGESEVVATDKRLREAALALGFAVFPLP
jgi:uncharacterized protein